MSLLLFEWSIYALELRPCGSWR